jgi:hypothetical protein
VKYKNKRVVNRLLSLMLVWVLILFASCSDDGKETETKPDSPKQVSKTNPMKVYMHYMPWFQAKPVSPVWGSHWKMANKNPDIIVDEATGKRQIASHYYPLIGPYDSKDPDVIEYHLLLIKYSGIDAVLIDWYGSHNLNDYRINLNATNAIIDKLDDVGLEFAAVYEEYTAGVVEDQTSKTAIDAAKADMSYLETNYFSNDQYLRINNTPVLLTFGPRFFKQPVQWTEIFASLETKPKFLPLWNHGGYVGDNDHGEFGWVDFNTSLTTLNNFYNKKSSVEILIGSAYPRFHDFYAQGGWGSSYGNVEANDGQTLANTLSLATSRNADYLQLVTWNDFGEGTQIEPTVEDGFANLLQIQEFTGVSYGLTELELIHQYYLKRKELKNVAEAQPTLKRVFECLHDLDVATATELMNQL